MLEQELALYDLEPDFDLNVMKPGLSLVALTGRVLSGDEEVLQSFKPDLVLVHGHASTTFAAILAAYYQQIPVEHIEAGLRTGDIYSPWTEEGKRKLTGALTQLHFAPTNTARDNLLREGIPESNIYVTGNTVIDALLSTREKIHGSAALRSEDRKSVV